MELRVIVNSYDPLDLAAGGAPEEEHDNISQKLIPLLYNDGLEPNEKLVEGLL